MDTVSGTQIGTAVMCRGVLRPYLEGRCKKSHKQQDGKQRIPSVTRFSVCPGSLHKQNILPAHVAHYYYSERHTLHLGLIPPSRESNARRGSEVTLSRGL